MTRGSEPVRQWYSTGSGAHNDVVKCLLRGNIGANAGRSSQFDGGTRGAWLKTFRSGIMLAQAPSFPLKRCRQCKREYNYRARLTKEGSSCRDSVRASSMMHIAWLESKNYVRLPSIQGRRAMTEETSHLHYKI